MDGEACVEVTVRAPAVSLFLKVRIRAQPRRNPSVVHTLMPALQLQLLPPGPLLLSVAEVKRRLSVTGALAASTPVPHTMRSSQSPSNIECGGRRGMV